MNELVRLSAGALSESADSSLSTDPEVLQAAIEANRIAEDDLCLPIEPDDLIHDPRLARLCPDIRIRRRRFSPKVPEPDLEDLQVLPADWAYDLGARSYDAWIWQKIWAGLEWPLLRGVLRNIADRSPLLDVGIGTGAVAERILQEFSVHKYYGVDVSRIMLRHCRARLGKRVSVTHTIAERMPYEDNFFSVALLCRVLSHIQDIEPTVIENSRVLKKGAIFIVTDIDPHHNYEFTRLPSYFGKLSVKTFKHDPDQLVEICRDRGLVLSMRDAVRANELRRLPLEKRPSSVDTKLDTPLLNLFVFIKHR